MGCGCNKSIKRTNNVRTQPIRNRVDRNLLPKRDAKRNNGNVIRRILERY
jgi:hypothetical protein